MGYDSDTARKYAHKAHEDVNAQQESIGMGPGRTGVKGVIRDRDEAAELEREKKAKEMESLRMRMEAGNLGGKTYLEEEREKAARGEDRFDDLILKELEREVSKRDVFGAPRARFGYLREVGVKQFVKAVEQEGRGVWVVVHIYDPVCPLFVCCNLAHLWNSLWIGAMFLMTYSHNLLKIIQRRNFFAQGRLLWSSHCSSSLGQNLGRYNASFGRTGKTTTSSSAMSEMKTTMTTNGVAHGLMTTISTSRCYRLYWFTAMES